MLKSFESIEKHQVLVIWGEIFLENNARAFIIQLNQLGTDLPRTLITRQTAWIPLFDFEIWHIPSKKHNVADEMSCKPPTTVDLVEAKAKIDIDDLFLQS